MTRAQYQLTLQAVGHRGAVPRGPGARATREAADRPRGREHGPPPQEPAGEHPDSTRTREARRRSGSPRQQIEDSLYSAYGQRQISTIYRAQQPVSVVDGAAPEFQNDPTVMRLLYIRAASGQLVPLESLVQIERGLGPLSVNHSGQLPSGDAVVQPAARLLAR